MIHPSEKNPPFYRSEKEISSMLAPMTTSQVEEKVEVEKNYFGYIINVVLSATWLLLFSSILAFQLMNFNWDIFRIYNRINPIERYVLALAALFLGSFHAYILFDSQEMKIKKKDSDLVSKLTSAWPLVLGTLLYFTVACFIYQKYWYPCQWDLKHSKCTNSFGSQNFIIFLVSLSIPVSFCAIFLFGDFSSSIFSLWTIKVDSQTVNETEESAFEFRITGFICYTGLAAYWLCFLLPYLSNLFKNSIFGNLLVICFLINFGSLLYTLTIPKYDSGDYSNWTEFLKKNWLIISSCSILSFEFIRESIRLGDFYSFAFCAIFYVLPSICTVLLSIPSNSSQSCVRHFKPWNSVKKFNHVHDSVKSQI